MRVCRLPSFYIPVVLPLTCCCAGNILGEDEVIKLDGLRNVTATVSASDDTYRIAIEMLAVKAFDPTTNKALNLSKARMYAARAMAKHLKTRYLTIRGLEIRESGAAGGLLRLIAFVPRDGVSTVKADTMVAQGEQTADAACPPSQFSNVTKLPPTRTSSRPREIRLAADATTRDFLNRKEDYLDTIVCLREALSEEGNSPEMLSLEPDDFYECVQDLEERAEGAFKTLDRQVKNDALLLSVEQEELVPALKKAHADVLGALKSAVARFDQRFGKAKKELRK